MNKTRNIIGIRKNLMIAFALLTFAQYDMAQDYAMPQVEAMTQSYFEVGHTEKTKRISAPNAIQVKIDTLFLGEKPKMFLCQDGESWVILANEQSVEPIVCLGDGQLDLDGITLVVSPF